MLASQAQKKGVGMDDQPQGEQAQTTAQPQPQAQTTAETVTQQSAMPTEAQQTSENQPTEKVAEPNQETRSQETEDSNQRTNQSKQDDLTLPENAKERTQEQFQKLKKRLRDERMARRKLEQYVRQASTQSQQAQRAKSVEDYLDQNKGQVDKGVYNPDTGTLNVDILEKKLKAADQYKKQLDQVSQEFQNYVIAQQEKETFASYPELDPNNTDFDEDLHRATRSFLLDSQVNPQDYGGRQLTFKEAADKASKFMKKRDKQVAKEAANQTMKQITQKEQASLQATGNSGNRTQARQDLGDLRNKTRLGNMEALLARMKGIPNKK